MSKLTYIRCGDYDIPNLKLSEQPETSIGKYGRMRKSYLKKHRPILYNHLLGIMLDIVSRVANSIFIPFTVGGGIRTVEDFTALLRAGADKVSVNSAALKNPQLIADAAYKFGSQCVVMAMDAKRRPNGAGWTLYLNGGRVDTGIDAVEWAKRAEKLGAGEILLTSMDCDGTKAGYDLELTRAVSESVGIPVIASGGAGKMEHFKDAFTKGKADAVLAASLFHFREIGIPELKGYLAENGIPVRR